MTEFFEEVEENLRSDRLKSIATRTWPYVVGALVLALVVALAWWGWDAYNRSQANKASETYAQALDVLASGNAAAADKAFGEVAASGPAVYKSLALMQQAGLRVTENKPAEAIKLLDAAADVAPSPVIEDAARLKAAYIAMDTAAFPEVETRLKPLTETGRPYRALAKEALAMAKLGAGKIDEAKSDFAALQLALDAPEAVRNRAQAVQVLIASGTAAAVPAVAKAAAEAPPPLPVPAAPAVAGAQTPVPAAPPGAPK